ncbi:MAG: lytic transglycosylase domain-containing protein [Rikenellaceae bacterium]|nr:lytic transglycosylase domain-containing protein [Rikenellaceae bacterium]
MKLTILLLAAVCALHASAQSPYVSLPPQEYAPVRVPHLPASLSFAGERVPLDNYDTRESLRRELLGTIYMHSRTLQTLLATTRYFPVIEPILEKYGIPADFKYLCMAESGLNPNVRSGAGAAGLWQLMPAVGRSYGLETGSNIDERYHIEKSTEAACKHLLSAYERFGSWTMAAAAYNVGETGLATRRDKQRTGNYYDLWLPEETMRYVFRILAFKLLTENPAAYGYVFSAADYDAPLADYREVTVDDAKIDWSAVAVANGTTYKMLRELNHWIRSYEYANPRRTAYTVKVPNEGFRKE